MTIHVKEISANFRILWNVKYFEISIRVNKHTSLFGIINNRAGIIAGQI